MRQLSPLTFLNTPSPRTFLRSSQIVDGGFASKAGMKVGDVIVAISGIFGGMNDVLGKGIEEV